MSSEEPTSAPRHISRRDSDEEDGRAGGNDNYNNGGGNFSGHETAHHNAHDDGRQEEGSVLYVSGIPSSATEHDLRDLFSPFGDLTRAQIMCDPHHPTPHRGFGFIAFTAKEAGDRATQELNGRDWMGRRLAVEPARRPRPHSPTPGRYQGTRKRSRERRGGRRRSPRRRLRSRSRSRSYDRYHYRRERSPGRPVYNDSYYSRSSAYYPPPPPPSAYPGYGYPPTYGYRGMTGGPGSASGSAVPPPPSGSAGDPYVPERPAFYPQSTGSGYRRY